MFIINFKHTFCKEEEEETENEDEKKVDGAVTTTGIFDSKFPTRVNNANFYSTSRLTRRTEIVDLLEDDIGLVKKMISRK